MDIQAVQQLANLVAQSSLYEVTIRDGQDSIRVKNSLGIQSTNLVQNTTLPNSQIDSSSYTDSPIQKKNLIHSRHIGWLRLGKDTLSVPLVKVGDTVGVGQTLAYVGVLGKLEPVVSDKAGKIEAILAENAHVVEYGTPLFALES